MEMIADSADSHSILKHLHNLIVQRKRLAGKRVQVATLGRSQMDVSRIAETH